MSKPLEFDVFSPPSLCEQQLRAESSRRRLRRQAALCLLGGLLGLIALALAAVGLRETAPALSLLCAAYVGCAALYSAVIACVFLRKRRRFAL